MRSHPPHLQSFCPTLGRRVVPDIMGNIVAWSVLFAPESYDWSKVCILKLAKLGGMNRRNSSRWAELRCSAERIEFTIAKEGLELKLQTPVGKSGTNLIVQDFTGHTVGYSIGPTTIRSQVYSTQPWRRPIMMLDAPESKSLVINCPKILTVRYEHM